MSFLRIAMLGLLLSACFSAFAQPGDLFDQTAVHAIRIEMPAADLTQMYANYKSKPAYKVRFIYDTGTRKDTIEQVEIHFRGNTSIDAHKKSFNLKFNEFVDGQRYQGVKEINLVGSHNDPTMARQKLYYDVWNSFGYPKRRTSFVKLYINNSYYGLYTNLEEMDDVFCEDQFGHSSGALFKCIWGADLTSKGTTGSSYKFGSPERVYQLKTNKSRDNYDDLAELISVINQNLPTADWTRAIEQVLDVDGFLRAYALDVLAGHWDNHAFNQNNFYLYRDPLTHRFSWIPYDTDNTFGINWISGYDWATRDVLYWHSSPRPLVSKLLAVPAYREKYKGYIRYLLDHQLHPDTLAPKVLAMRSLIAPAAQADTWRTLDYGFTYQQFWDGFTTNNNTAWQVVYGILPFATARKITALQQVSMADRAPLLGPDARFMALPVVGQPIHFSVAASDVENQLDSVMLWYSVDSLSFSALPMALNGGDNYMTSIAYPSGKNRIIYYFTAKDQAGAQVRYPASSNRRLTLIQSVSPLKINEILAKNSGIVRDNFNEADDFAELYNTGNASELLTWCYLSDDPNQPDKWPLAPGTLLPAGAFALCWMDDDESQGTWHASFKLDGSDSFLGLYGDGRDFFPLLDSFRIQNATSNTAMARIPDGVGDWVATQAVSPLAPNAHTAADPRSMAYAGLTILQNPAREVLRLRWPDDFSPDTILILDASGQEVRTFRGKSREEAATLHLDGLPQGWYLIHAASETAALRAPFVWLP